MQLLSDEWLAAQQASTCAIAVRPGASARIEYRVTGGPDGDVVVHTELTDGRITENALGPDEDADFSMIVPYELFARAAAGEYDLSVGFMRGEVKVTGDLGRLLSVLPVTTSDAWRQAARELAESVDASG